MTQLTHMKKELRTKFRQARRLFDGSMRKECDGLIASAFLSEYGKYGSFFIYNSFGDEADTHKITAQLLAMGKSVYLPRVEGKNIVAVPYGALKKGAYGIEEPTGEPYFGRIDVAVVPLLAINSRGYRLGYGGGYYDRFLANQGKTALKIGICYDFQIVDKIPAEGHDVPADAIVTDARIFRRANTEE